MQFCVGGCRLMRLAKACPDFAPLVAGICVAPDPLERALAEELRQLTHPKQWLMALHLTCTYLAAKNVDKVPCLPALSAPPAQSQGSRWQQFPCTRMGSPHSCRCLGKSPRMMVAD